MSINSQLFKKIVLRTTLWYLDHLAGVFAVLFSIGIAVTFAATSYDVNNEPQMYLYSSLTTTQTTGVVIESLQLNGDNWQFATTTGGVLRIRSGTYREDIYYSSASVNATTNRVTLSGVVRNICPHTITYTSCGDGRRWGRGAIIELIQDARLFNLKLNRDRATSTIGSGALVCGSTSQPCVFPGTYTTAQRDAFTFTNSNAFHFIFNSTKGVAQYYNPSAGGYYDFGSGSLIDATESLAGKVQLASTGSMAAHNVTGSTGATEVLQTRYVTSTGGTVNRWRSPLLGRLGTLTGSILGTGTMDSTHFLAGDGVFRGTYPLTTAKSTSYTAAANELVIVTSSGGNITVTLPASPSTDDRIGVLFNDLTSGSGAVSINGNGKYILGNSGSLAVRGDMRMMQYNGTQWNVIDERITTHRAKLRRTTAQSIANGTQVRIHLADEDVDVGHIGLEQLVTNSGALIRRAGTYSIYGKVGIVGIDDAEYVEALIYKNGSEIASNYTYASAATQNTYATVSTTVNLAVGDKIELYVLHNEGAAANTDTTDQGDPELYIFEIRP